MDSKIEEIYSDDELDEGYKVDDMNDKPKSNPLDFADAMKKLGEYYKSTEKKSDDIESLRKRLKFKLDEKRKQRTKKNNRSHNQHTNESKEKDEQNKVSMTKSMKRRLRKKRQKNNKLVEEKTETNEN